MNYRGISLSSALAVACMALSCSAYADNVAGSTPSRANGPCESDAQYYCAATASDATDCLIDHQKEISDACYNDLKRKLQSGGGSANNSGNGSQNTASATGMKACKQDSQQFCSGVEKGGGRIVQCLKEHQQDLSDACYDALSQRQSRKH